MSSELVPKAHPVSSSSTLAERVRAVRLQSGRFLLLDCSFSMTEVIRPGVRAIDELRKTARQFRNDAPTLRQVIFPTRSEPVEEVTSDIPDTCTGTGTPLAAAIRFAAQRGALHLIIVSDGIPDNTEDAIAAAEEARCQIDVVYIGRRESEGERFLRKLAAAHGGGCGTVNLKTPKALESKIRGYLEA